VEAEAWLQEFDAMEQHGASFPEHALEMAIGSPADDIPSTPTPTLGTPVAGVTYAQRFAAYAVIRNRAGAVAAVHGPGGYWLPGGGSRPGETPAETVVREAGEEIGGTLHLVSKIGEAVQYFFAVTEGQYYVMQAVFFRAHLAEGVLGPAEYEMCWLDVSHPAPWFFHACHDWAVQQG
jgi:8-oxo-dGTP pyrophosphatase MutT (NUDIX family)